MVEMVKRYLIVILSANCILPGLYNLENGNYVYQIKKHNVGEKIYKMNLKC